VPLVLFSEPLYKLRTDELFRKCPPADISLSPPDSTEFKIMDLHCAVKNKNHFFLTQVILLSILFAYLMHHYFQICISGKNKKYKIMTRNKTSEQLR
jgi:hypothetical protein